MYIGSLPKFLQASPEGIRSVLHLSSIGEAEAIASETNRATERLLSRRTVRIQGPDFGIIASTLDANDVVLALPLHAASVLSIRHLGIAISAECRIQYSSLVEALTLSELTQRSVRGTQMVSDRQLLALAREERGSHDAPRLWITFPDHSVASPGCRFRGTLLDRPHYFSMIEVLLAARTGAAIYTISGVDSTYSFVPLPWQPCKRRVIVAAEVQALYEALGVHLSSVLRRTPTAIASWSRLARSSEDEVRARERRYATTLRAILVAARGSTNDAEIRLRIDESAENLNGLDVSAREVF